MVPGETVAQGRFLHGTVQIPEERSEICTKDPSLSRFDSDVVSVAPKRARTYT